MPFLQARYSTSNPSTADALPTQPQLFGNATASLSELEERLADAHFVRIAKNCLVNLCRIAGLKPYVGGRLLARLDNNEEIVISRKYASAIKKLLGA